MIKYDELKNKVSKILNNKRNAKTKEERSKYQKELTEYTNKHIKPLFMKTDLLKELILDFSKVKLIYTDDGKVSASKTYAKMYNNHYQLNMAATLLAIHPTRSIFYNNSTEHGVLVPLFMMAHKKYNNIAYEEWDKNDPAIAYAVGLTLWTGIKDWLKKEPLVDDNLLELRKSIFDSSKRVNKTYAGYLSKAGEVEGVKVPALTAIIKCQFWIANAQNRTKYMILDTVNWDNMPEAFDEKIVVEQVIKDEDEIDYTAMPWVN